MKRRRFTARTDANQREIVTIARRCGAVVVDLHALPDVGADLLVGHRGRWALWEVKDGRLPTSRRRLTSNEKRMMTICETRGLAYWIIENAGDVHVQLGSSFRPIFASTTEGTP